MNNDDSGVNQWREAFHSLKRRDRERVMINIVRGINRLSGRFLDSVENDTFVSIFSNEMDEIVETDFIPNLLQALCNLKESASYMEEEIDCGKRIDMAMPSIINNLENDFGDLNWIFTNVYAEAAVQKTKDQKENNIPKERSPMSRMPTCNNGVISANVWDGSERRGKIGQEGNVIQFDQFQKRK